MRFLEESRQDRLKTKKILEALASGHKGSTRSTNEGKSRGLYGLDELVAGDITENANKSTNENDENEEETEDINFEDDEELQAKYLNQMKSRIKGQKEETAIDELTDDDEDEDQQEGEENENLHLTPEEKIQRAKIIAQEKENYKRYFEQALRNRALRLNKIKEKEELSLNSSLPLPSWNILVNSLFFSLFYFINNFLIFSILSISFLAYKPIYFNQ